MFSKVVSLSAPYLFLLTTKLYKKNQSVRGNPCRLILFSAAKSFWYLLNIAWSDSVLTFIISIGNFIYVVLPLVNGSIRLFLLNPCTNWLINKERTLLSPTIPLWSSGITVLSIQSLKLAIPSLVAKLNTSPPSLISCRVISFPIYFWPSSILKVMLRLANQPVISTSSTCSPSAFSCSLVTALPYVGFSLIRASL